MLKSEPRKYIKWNNNKPVFVGVKQNCVSKLAIAALVNIETALLEELKKPGVETPG